MALRHRPQLSRAGWRETFLPSYRLVGHRLAPHLLPRHRLPPHRLPRPHGLSSSVQHLGPPPALRNSDMSTGTGSNPRAESWAASAIAWAGRATRYPSLTAVSPSAAASSSVASTSSVKHAARAARPAAS